MSCEHKHYNINKTTRVRTCRGCGAYQPFNQEWVLLTVEITKVRYEQLLVSESCLDALLKKIDTMHTSVFGKDGP